MRKNEVFGWKSRDSLRDILPSFNRTKPTILAITKEELSKDLDQNLGGKIGHDKRLGFLRSPTSSDQGLLGFLGKLWPD